MTDEPRQLDVVQRWLQSVIMHPDGIEAGIASDAARGEIDLSPGEIENVISRSRSLSSIERLAVYGNAYYARLLECLGGVYPVLAQALGEELFHEFAFSYLQAYPSQSYTLNELGRHFARYLEETRPDRDEQGTSDAGGLPAEWPDFLIDLARLEWAIAEVFDGPGIENAPRLSAGQVEQVPPDDWPDARLVPAPCLRVLAFRFPVSDYFTAVRGDRQPEFPRPADSYLALTRINYVVRRFDLTPPQHKLLRAIDAGETVGAAITAVAAMVDDLEPLAAELRGWFADWSSWQFFSGIELGGE